MRDEKYEVIHRRGSEAQSSPRGFKQQAFSATLHAYSALLR